MPTRCCVWGPVLADTETMVRMLEPVDAAPFPVPVGRVREESVYTGTACLALIDVAHVADVWEDLLFDGHDHEHAAGGLMVNGASVGTHLDHDGDFPVDVVVDEHDHVVGLRVNLDPYAHDLLDVRHDDSPTTGHGHSHEHGHGVSGDAHTHDESTGHGHGHGHAHGHDDDATGHGHGHGESGHAEGWSDVSTVRLDGARAVFGDPAGVDEADGTGGLLDLVFPAPGGLLTLSVNTHDGIRSLLQVTWSA